MWLKYVTGALIGVFALTNTVASNIDCFENNNIQLCNTERDVHVLSLKREPVDCSKKTS